MVDAADDGTSGRRIASEPDRRPGDARQVVGQPVQVEQAREGTFDAVEDGPAEVGQLGLERGVPPYREAPGQRRWRGVEADDFIGYGVRVVPHLFYNDVVAAAASC